MNLSPLMQLAWGVPSSTIGSENPSLEFAVRQSPKLSDHPELIPMLTFQQFEEWRVGLERAANNEKADEAAVTDLLRNPTIHYWYVLLEMYKRLRLDLPPLNKDESHKLFPTLSEQVGRAYIDRLVRACLIRTVRQGRASNVELSASAAALVAHNIDQWSERFGGIHAQLVEAERRRNRPKD